MNENGGEKNWIDTLFARLKANAAAETSDDAQAILQAQEELAHQQAQLAELMSGIQEKAQALELRRRLAEEGVRLEELQQEAERTRAVERKKREEGMVRYRAALAERGPLESEIGVWQQEISTVLKALSALWQKRQQFNERIDQLNARINRAAVEAGLAAPGEPFVTVPHIRSRTNADKYLFGSLDQIARYCDRLSFFNPK